MRQPPWHILTTTKAWHTADAVCGRAGRSVRIDAAGGARDVANSFPALGGTQVMRQKFLFALLFMSLAIVASDATRAAKGFAWEDGNGETTLLFGGKPAMRYIHPTFDDSSADSIQNTFKPYHHVFSPDGETVLTKGPGGLYTHHRALFFGFNKVTYDGDKHCDVWHCTDGAHQQHVKELAREADENHARQRVAIDWYGGGDQPFAHEQRELTVTRPKHNGVAGWQIDFKSHVATADGKPIHLDGDPQHAGFHFRAAQEDIENTKEADQNQEKQIYFVRTDGNGTIGETRNWDPQKEDDPASVESVNCPWDAMSFELHGKRYTVLYLDHPSNPKPSRSSERAYGRFGSYFVADVTDAMPLNVKYRVWVQAGEMTVDQCAHLSSDFNAEGTVLPSESAVLK